MKEEVFARVLLQIASLIINNGLVILADRWNRGVRALNDARMDGTTIPDEVAKDL